MAEVVGNSRKVGIIPNHQSEVNDETIFPREVTGPVDAKRIDEHPRQVIAVSASKGPAAFFNLTRKFLVTDEYCDLSALEGAIVAAVDAAHLLERSKLARIVRVNTSYVTVEPKRKKQHQQQGKEHRKSLEAISLPLPYETAYSEDQDRRNSSTRELRRARIVITVRRTESYKMWLEDNSQRVVISESVSDRIIDDRDQCNIQEMPETANCP